MDVEVDNGFCLEQIDENLLTGVKNASSSIHQELDGESRITESDIVEISKSLSPFDDDLEIGNTEIPDDVEVKTTDWHESPEPSTSADIGAVVTTEPRYKTRMSSRLKSKQIKTKAKPKAAKEEENPQVFVLDTNGGLVIPPMSGAKMNRVKLDLDHDDRIKGNYYVNKEDMTHVQTFVKQNYERINDGERSVLMCLVCKKTFKRHGNLHYHMASHSDKRPFTCKICGNTYKQRDTVKSHINVSHLKTVTYICRTCHATFLSRPSLYKHLRVKKH